MMKAEEEAFVDVTGRKILQVFLGVLTLVFIATYLLLFASISAVALEGVTLVRPSPPLPQEDPDPQSS